MNSFSSPCCQLEEKMWLDSWDIVIKRCLLALRLEHGEKTQWLGYGGSTGGNAVLNESGRKIWQAT